MVSLLEQNQLDYFIEKNPSWEIDNKTIKKEFKIQIGRIHIIKLKSI